MPNIKSAKKRVKITETKTLQNKMAKSALKTELKKYDAALAAGDKAALDSEYKLAVKTVDQAASNGLISKQAAARKKSSMTLIIIIEKRFNLFLLSGCFSLLFHIKCEYFRDLPVIAIVKSLRHPQDDPGAAVIQ